VKNCAWIKLFNSGQPALKLQTPVSVMKRTNMIFTVLLITFLQVNTSLSSPGESVESDKTCIGCHSKVTVLPGIYRQWKMSLHANVDVGCYECHKANKSDKDGFNHHGKYISIIVSPEDCAKCHQKEAEEFADSIHSDSICLVDSELGMYLIKNIEGINDPKIPGASAAGNTGCRKCHGSTVTITANGKTDSGTWPNTGMGRINPDGSKGTCTACHLTHEFSRSQVRQPETCGACHNQQGGHPQIEIFKQSKHGVAYYTNKEQMNLDSTQWVLGVDYTTAPTCSSCHISATIKLPITHNINLRVNYSEKMIEASGLGIHDKCKLPFKNTCKMPLPRQEHKENMIQVCTSCHSKSLVDNFYSQFEEEASSFMNKWIEPGRELYLKAQKIIKETGSYDPLTNSLDYAWVGMCNSHTVYAYSGAAMSAPGWADQGNMNLAASWYNEFIPTIQQIITKGKQSTSTKAQKLAVGLEKYLKKNVLENPIYYGFQKQNNVQQ